MPQLNKSKWFNLYWWKCQYQL